MRLAAVPDQTAYNFVRIAISTSCQKISPLLANVDLSAEKSRAVGRDQVLLHTTEPNAPTNILHMNAIGIVAYAVKLSGIGTYVIMYHFQLSARCHEHATPTWALAISRSRTGGLDANHSRTVLSPPLTLSPAEDVRA